jgi:hypothetical protein
MLLQHFSPLSHYRGMSKVRWSARRVLMTRLGSLVLARKLVLDLSKDGPPLLLLLVGGGGNALAAGSALGRDIGVFAQILQRSRGGCAA